MSYLCTALRHECRSYVLHSVMNVVLMIYRIVSGMSYFLLYCVMDVAPTYLLHCVMHVIRTYVSIAARHECHAYLTTVLIYTRVS